MRPRDRADSHGGCYAPRPNAAGRLRVVMSPTRLYATGMGWPDTLIAAAAAIGGGVIGAYASLLQMRATLKSDKKLQDDQLVAAMDLSREEREHQQRRDAYVPMMEYVTWAKRVNQVRTEAVNRRAHAVREVRPDNIKDMTAEAAVAMRAAYDKNGPTEWERETIAAGPTPQDRFRILGLVTAFASEDVLTKFLTLVDGTERIEKAIVSLEKALMDYPGPLGSEPSIHETAVAAEWQINSAWNTAKAGFELLDATKLYSGVVASVEDTAREELARIRSEVKPSQS
jgi:hypothetical protein